MNTTRHRPSTSLRHSPEARPGLLVTIALMLIGGATGGLTGSPAGIVIIAVIGLAWGAALTLAVRWLVGQQPSPPAGAIAILLVLFVLVALLAGSLPDDRALGAVIIGVILAVGASLTLAGIRLAHRQPSRQAWARAVLFQLVALFGVLTGSSFAAQLLMATALDTGAPEFFTALIRGTLGDAQALPFYMLNTPTEWLLLPLALLLTWPMTGQRRLMLIAFGIFVVHRVWTYLYFAPRITDWEEGTAPLTAQQLDQATLWVELSWVRFAWDLAILLLVILAAFTRTDAPAPRTSAEQPASA